MLRSKPLEESVGINGIVMCTLTIIFMAMVFLYVYINILRPFDKMKDYASEVAKGNFDLPLNYERSNYFGAFTWAFDSMRKEITRSRMAEREAIENNKTVIATLSHDIKTPITSIRAYAEGLEENLDTSQERRSRYLEVLMRKCDEVTELTNDLFLHSLSDLNMLQMQPEEFELVPFLKQSISEIAAEREDVLFRKPDISPVVYVDKKRINQIVENLINNSRKYAKTNIIVSITQSNDIVSIHFRDKGPGIPDEDMPFITDKFYRGKNVGDENGSGLGLYIVRYIAEQSGGSLELINHTSGEEGLEAVVSLPIKKH
jgi:signal transduction histidine kinase